MNKLHECSTCRFGWVDWQDWYCENSSRANHGHIGTEHHRCRSWEEELPGQRHDNWRECVKAGERE